MASFVYTQQTLAETGFTPFPELVITQQALAEPGYQDSTPHVDLYQTMVEIGWRSPSIKVYAVVMDRPDGSKSILGVPEPGDRSAWDVGDFDELHASDIDADELVRHTPLPGTPGDMIVEGVSGFWTRVTMYGDATLDPDGRLNLTGAVSGESSFIDLTDTPATYVGSGGKIVRVVDAATALQFGADLDNLDDVNAPAPAEGQVLTYRASFGEWRAENPAGGGGGPTSFFVEDEGSLLSGHVDRLDFRGAGVTATRINKKEVRVTIPGGGGGGASSFFVEDEGSVIESETSRMNFVGSGVTASKTAAGEVEINITGGGGGGDPIYEEWDPDAPPTSFNPRDDEFDASSFLGWTEWDPGSVGLTYTQEYNRLLVEAPQNAPFEMAGIYKNLPGGSEWTLVTKISWMAQQGSGFDGMMVSLSLFEDLAGAPSTSDIYTLRAQDAASEARAVALTRWNAYNSFNANVVRFFPWGVARRIYLRIRRNGSTYAVEASEDGIGWHRIYNSTLAFTPAEMGLAFINTSGATAYAWVHYFRAKNRDVGFSSPVHGRMIGRGSA